MKKNHNADPFRNSMLDRAKPTTMHRFNSILKRHRSTTGMVTDSTNSTLIVRIICGLLFIHLLIIGGVLVRGQLMKSEAGVAVSPTMTPPPAAPAATEVEKPGEPSTVNMNVAPVINPQAAVNVAAPGATHITQAPAVGAADDTAEEVTTVTPVTEQAPAQPAAPSTVTVKHLVSSGDSWARIAQQNGTTVAALKAANPKAAAKPTLQAGIYLDVPVSADSEKGKAAAAKQAATAAVERGKVYTVKPGDSLGKIAAKHKISVSKLRSLNDLTPADDKRIKAGMELKVAE